MKCDYCGKTIRGCAYEIEDEIIVCKQCALDYQIINEDGEPMQDYEYETYGYDDSNEF